MKKEIRKLNLVRETLAPLQQDELAAVHGGESYSVSYSGYSVSVSRSVGYSVSVNTKSIGRSVSHASVSFSGG
ncbi:MAG: class I lanthipeptide [Deltaproteobacteria bacterium]|nr:class I lanthipeptide [Deltaproteobacteria bacterium]MCW5803197.1 class I lanthipeptide [Deltaproteobacteria bacterium]